MLDGTVKRLLIDRGPLSATELLKAAQESGSDLGPSGEEALLAELHGSAGGFTRLDDGRWAHIAEPGHRRVVTHRLTQPEIVHDALTITPDLVLIPALEDDSDLLRPTDRGTLTCAFPPWLETDPDDRPADAFDDNGSLQLPPGTLGDLNADEGDLVSLRITTRGVR